MNIIVKWVLSQRRYPSYSHKNEDQISHNLRRKQEGKDRMRKNRMRKNEG